MINSTAVIQIHVACSRRSVSWGLRENGDRKNKGEKKTKKGEKTKKQEKGKKSEKIKKKDKKGVDRKREKRGGDIEGLAVFRTAPQMTIIHRT